MHSELRTHKAPRTHTTLRRSIASAAIAAPVALLLAACGIPADLSLGDSVDISNGSVTVTSIEERPASDVADIELDELAGQTPYFVRFEVQAEGDDFDENLWKGKATGGEVTPLNIIDISGGFDCNGLGEIVDGTAEGCQLMMVESGETLESVSYGQAATWKASE
ncbi:hypothetical protein [Herbiconiux liukaitaii]|uniref:hypothetical protein n=1 Tax=Herbiconiux liukaitaii TaxID=3342799 RepID=UPI0035B83793